MLLVFLDLKNETLRLESDVLDQSNYVDVALKFDRAALPTTFTNLSVSISLMINGQTVDTITYPEKDVIVESTDQETLLSHRFVTPSNTYCSIEVAVQDGDRALNGTFDWETAPDADLNVSDEAVPVEELIQEMEDIANAGE